MCLPYSLQSALFLFAVVCERPLHQSHPRCCRQVCRRSPGRHVLVKKGVTCAQLTTNSPIPRNYFGSDHSISYCCVRSFLGYLGKYSACFRGIRKLPPWESLRTPITPFEGNALRSFAPITRSLFRHSPKDNALGCSYLHGRPLIRNL